MSETLVEQPRQLTLSWGDSPARTCPAQARALALLASVRPSGLSFPGSSESSAPSGWSWRTSHPERAGGSMPSAPTWDGEAMKRFRSLCQRRMSELRTSEGESLLLPTPTASQGGYNQGGAAGRVGPKRYSLVGLARRGLLPTPTASPNANRTTKLPPSVLAGRHGKQLAGVLATPTKTANQLSPAMAKWSVCKGWQDLHPPGPLLPSFVEWMMGFPTGWTVCEPSETPSSPRSPK